MSDDRLAALSAAGVSIWLDDLGREPARHRQPRRARRRLARRRRHHQPVDLREGDRAAAPPVRRPGARPRGPRRRRSTRPCARSRPTTCAGPATSSRPVYDAHRRRRRPGVASRSTRGSRTTPSATDRRGQGAALGGRPAQRAASRSRPRSRACRRSPRCSAQGISVNVTLIFSLERYRAVHRRLPRRPRAGARPTGTTCRRIDSVASFFVCRVDTEVDKRLTRSAPEAPALRGKAAIANARLALRGLRRGRSPPTRWQALAAAGRARAAAAVGLDRRQGPGVRRHPVRRRPRRRRTPSTRCPRRRSTPSPTTAWSAATRSSPSTPRRTPRSTRSRAAGIDLDDVVRVLEDEGVEKFVAVVGRSCSTRVTAALAAARRPRR